MLLPLPTHVTDFISAISALKPPPVSIWVIGSRANGRATEQSDTDLLVFGSMELLAAISSRLMQPKRIDCLIIYNNNDYRDPWQRKTGSLTKLKWNQIDSTSATYIGVKWVPDEGASAQFGGEMGEIVCLQELAFRVWP